MEMGAVLVRDDEPPPGGGGEVLGGGDGPGADDAVEAAVASIDRRAPSRRGFGGGGGVGRVFDRGFAAIFRCQISAWDMHDAADRNVAIFRLRICRRVTGESEGRAHGESRNQAQPRGVGQNASRRLAQASAAQDCRAGFPLTRGNQGSYPPPPREIRGSWLMGSTFLLGARDPRRERGESLVCPFARYFGGKMPQESRVFSRKKNFFSRQKKRRFTPLPRPVPPRTSTPCRHTPARLPPAVPASERHSPYPHADW